MDEAPAVPAGIAQNLVQLRARAMARVAAPRPHLLKARTPIGRAPGEAGPQAPPGPAPRTHSVAAKTLDLSGRPLERLGAGLALRNPQGHLRHDGLVIDLRGDCRGRRCAGDDHLLIALVGIVR